MRHTEYQYERNSISSFGIDSIGIFGSFLLSYRYSTCEDREYRDEYHHISDRLVSYIIPAMATGNTNPIILPWI